MPRRPVELNTRKDTVRERITGLTWTKQFEKSRQVKGGEKGNPRYRRRAVKNRGKEKIKPKQ